MNGTDSSTTISCDLVIVSPKSSRSTRQYIHSHHFHPSPTPFLAWPLGIFHTNDLAHPSLNHHLITFLHARSRYSYGPWPPFLECLLWLYLSRASSRYYARSARVRSLYMSGLGLRLIGGPTQSPRVISVTKRTESAFDGMRKKRSKRRWV